jgi:hypothetical protein
MPPSGMAVPVLPAKVSGVGVLAAVAVGSPLLVVSRAMVAWAMVIGLVPRASSSLMRTAPPEMEGLRAMRKVWLLKLEPWKL